MDVDISHPFSWIAIFKHFAETISQIKESSLTSLLYCWAQAKALATSSSEISSSSNRLHDGSNVEAACQVERPSGDRESIKSLWVSILFIAA